jgi:hypothetical protein
MNTKRPKKTTATHCDPPLPCQERVALTNKPQGRMAMQIIAQHAADVRDVKGPNGPDDRMSSWIVSTDYGTYTITIECKYRT